MIPVPEVTGLDITFGNIKHLPKWEDIPEIYKRGNNFWNNLTSQWFFCGLKQEDLATFKPRDGVDNKKAMMALSTILSSFEPKHEHKEAGVAYLLSEWFEEVKN